MRLVTSPALSWELEYLAAMPLIGHHAGASAKPIAIHILVVRDSRDDQIRESHKRFLRNCLALL